MSGNSPAGATTVACLPLPAIRAMQWLYLTVFGSAVVVLLVATSTGVAFDVALPTAVGLPVAVVSLVNSMVGRVCTPGGRPGQGRRALDPGMRPRALDDTSRSATWFTAVPSYPGRTAARFLARLLETAVSHAQA